MGASGDGIPAWLAEALAGRPELVIVAPRRYRLRAMDIDQPALMIPLAGRKILAEGQTAAELGPGRYLMIHRALRCTVQNIPEHGDYQAWCIAFPWRVIGLARTLLDAHAPPPVPGPNHSCGALAALHAELAHLLAAQCGGADPGTLDHALLGVLLALHRHGDDQFRLAQDLSVAARVRLVVGAAPGRDWCSADLEESLHMSGATLRRRLADEGTSLRIVLRDARLHHALALLQTTRRPLRAIALACGYRSLPSFARQFEARFGVDPVAISNAAPGPDRTPAASRSVPGTSSVSG
ncbi:helix-turn-helix transcriptional regulator [Pseudoduganella sp. SL102]|uniref:helix-turn-helix transcriptional regulator n=1 Tax=Pseudoduganella sp. SL102 TaxID=2995154 RepID=UPI00248B416C|nr:helix-turn-helix transcriptional regulator [Pseudoduganella sp. SL102]WBS02585.1 helix-turn-helix transcriptional regulator [Pseudoduganella sp. SL102]